MVSIQYQPEFLSVNEFLFLHAGLWWVGRIFCFYWSNGKEMCADRFCGGFGTRLRKAEIHAQRVSAGTGRQDRWGRSFWEGLVWAHFSSYRDKLGRNKRLNTMVGLTLVFLDGHMVCFKVDYITPFIWKHKLQNLHRKLPVNGDMFMLDNWLCSWIIEWGCGDELSGLPTKQEAWDTFSSCPPNPHPSVYLAQT